MNLRVVEMIGQDALWTVLLLSAAPVLAALMVGLFVSLMQAATQIQDQTLGSVPKILAVYVVLLVAGLWMLGTLQAYATRLFETVGQVGR